jgi:hypothetical protein
MHSFVPKKKREKVKRKYFKGKIKHSRDIK